MKKAPKIYKARTLFSGKVIGKDPAINYVGVPGAQTYESKNNFSKEKNFLVEYNGDQMRVANWHINEAIRTFDDIQGRGHYKLAYFKWQPIEAEVILNPTFAIANSINKSPKTKKAWDNLRKMLHGK